MSSTTRQAAARAASTNTIPASPLRRRTTSAPSPGTTLGDASGARAQGQPNQTSKPQEATRIDLSPDGVRELGQLIDALTHAVGRSSAHFKSQQQGTWQHELLLAAKELVVWHDRHFHSS